MRYSHKLFRRGLRLKLLIAILCCACLFTGTSAISFGSSGQSIAGGANFSLQPLSSSNSTPGNYFVIAARQGTLLQEQVRVTNVGTAEGTVKLFPVDAGTGQTGGIVYLSQVKHDIGSWITLAAKQLTLASGQSQIVQFQIAIPQNGRSGQHVGGIVALGAPHQSSTSTLGKSHFQINVQQQSIIAVELNLPGPQTEQLAATGIQIGGSNGYQSLLVGLQNTGNLLISGYGTLQVGGAQGKLLQNLTVNFGAFLPQTSIKYAALVQKKALGVGTYQAVLTLHYGRNHVFDHILNYTTTLTISQQQVQQVFPNAPLQAPLATSSFLPLWAMILLAALGVLIVGGLSGLFFWRLAIRSVTGPSSTEADAKQSKRNKKG